MNHYVSFVTSHTKNIKYDVKRRSQAAWRVGINSQAVRHTTRSRQHTNADESVDEAVRRTEEKWSIQQHD